MKIEKVKYAIYDNEAQLFITNDFQTSLDATKDEKPILYETYIDASVVVDYFDWMDLSVKKVKETVIIEIL